MPDFRLEDYIVYGSKWVKCGRSRVTKHSDTVLISYRSLYIVIDLVYRHQMGARAVC